MIFRIIPYYTVLYRSSLKTLNKDLFRVPVTQWAGPRGACRYTSVKQHDITHFTMLSESSLESKTFLLRKVLAAGGTRSIQEFVLVAGIGGNLLHGGQGSEDLAVHGDLFHVGLAHEVELLGNDAVGQIRKPILVGGVGNGIRGDLVLHDHVVAVLGGDHAELAHLGIGQGIGDVVEIIEIVVAGGKSSCKVSNKTLLTKLKFP